MRNSDIAINIRLALLDLGRDPKQKLPRTQAALKQMLAGLRVEQKEKRIAA